MIDKGMENQAGTLKGLIALADKRIEEVKSGTTPALSPATMLNTREVVIDLDVIDQPMIADPDVNNDDASNVTLMMLSALFHTTMANQ